MEERETFLKTMFFYSTLKDDEVIETLNTERLIRFLYVSVLYVIHLFVYVYFYYSVHMKLALNTTTLDENHYYGLV